MPDEVLNPPDLTTPVAPIENPEQPQPLPKRRKLHPKLLKFVLLPLLGIFLLAGIIGKLLLAPSDGQPMAVLGPPPGSVSVTAAPTGVQTSKPADGIVASIKRHGGLCRTGMECSSIVLIMRDKRIVVDGKVKDVMPESNFASLAAQINNTNFAEIKKKKFTGTCPTAYDATEAIYTFATANGIEVIKSCETEIDPHNPLFTLLNSIY
jgi:hypothetical protein